jgi:hypothetical protein
VRLKQVFSFVVPFSLEILFKVSVFESGFGQTILFVKGLSLGAFLFLICTNLLQKILLSVLAIKLAI